MLERKSEMLAYMDEFRGMPDRLLKYNEILLEGEDASPECYQDSMSYRRLAVALSSCCNLSCIWCYRHDPMFKPALGKFLDLDIYGSFIENTQGKFRRVHLSGLGEPTLHPRFIEAIEISKRLSDNIRVTSNGSLLTPESVDRFVDAGLTEIEISIDAFNRDELMKFRGVELERMIDLIAYISDETPLFLQINSVVNTLNYTHLAPMVDVCGHVQNIRVWHTIPLFKTAQMREAQIHPLSVDEYQSLLLELEEAVTGRNLPWKLEPNAHGAGLDPIIEMKRKRNICFTCFEDPSISVSGRLSYCSRQDYSASVDISAGFEQAWNSPDLLGFRRNMLKGDYPDYCGKLCYLKDKSQGAESCTSMTQ